MAEEQWINGSPSEPLVQVRADEEGGGESTTTTTTRGMLGLEVLWNLALTLVSVGVLCATLEEQPNTPIRVWIIVYASQCLLDVILLLIDTCVLTYRGYLSRLVKLCKSINTAVSFIWWIVGIYWIISGGHTLKHKASYLYWLAVVLITYRICIALIICVALPCICCCVPFVIGILKAGPEQESGIGSNLIGDVEAGSNEAVDGKLNKEHVIPKD